MPPRAVTGDDRVMTRPALIPCANCHRHVKSGATVCPFCDAARAASFVVDHAPDTRGWKRAAVFSFGLAVAGCGSTTTGSSGDAMALDAVADTAGDAPAEAAADVRADGPAEDHGGVAPPYGIAPRDAGFPEDDGSFKADYGAPPPPRDASAE